MKHPRVVVYEKDGRLAQLLRELIQARRWAFREPRQLETCWRELGDGDPIVLVLKLGNKLEQELSILEQLHGRIPAIRTVVVGDLENEALAHLAWDLGASYVLFPPMPSDLLGDIVVQMMASAIERPPAGAVESLEQAEEALAPVTKAQKSIPDRSHG